ncbi:MAG: ATP-binding protein [Xenococcaceae cyanobacterium MO_207.B15]|nr:ATP-binding protein [Xenococcaceae cyanobacterium MO_207.B15]
MFKLNLPNPFKDNQNKLFGQTRWRLATWYAGIMGAILALSGLGVYQAVTYAHRLTILKELELVANNLHETLEPILEKPGKLTPAATTIFPNLCVVGTECSPVTEETQRSILQPRANYYIRLVDPAGNLVAVSGKQPKNLRLNGAKYQQDLVDADHNHYQQVSLMLHNKDFKIWGYLQVGRNLPEYGLYIIRLRLIFLTGLLVVMIILIIMSWWLAGVAMQPIRQSYQLLQQFTADAAHELRTPLAAIRATVESSLMMPQIRDIEARETLQAVGRQNGRLANLVADLLMLCRMEPQLSVKSFNSIGKEKVSLSDLTQDIAEDFASLAIKSEIKLVTQILVFEPLIIIGNYEQLYRLGSNLVVNALKYTNPGGQVRLILSRRAKYALLQIEDNGIGISEEDLNKIFDRFYRVNSDRSRHTGGSGLGLSIAQAITQSHQGKIGVESQLGKGSTFTISLPIIENKSYLKI